MQAVSEELGTQFEGPNMLLHGTSAGVGFGTRQAWSPHAPHLLAVWFPGKSSDKPGERGATPRLLLPTHPSSALPTRAVTTSSVCVSPLLTPHTLPPCSPGLIHITISFTSFVWVFTGSLVLWEVRSSLNLHHPLRSTLLFQPILKMSKQRCRSEVR